MIQLRYYVNEHGLKSLQYAKDFRWLDEEGKSAFRLDWFDVPLEFHPEFKHPTNEEFAVKMAKDLES
ncbi:MAG: hypothetical protein BWZ03_00072 [bacterium ADurb.BinA186]|nr:MAG: hypothetical protein BWZ03_00072 [bacterium ADurb.BinA186]